MSLWILKTTMRPELGRMNNKCREMKWFSGDGVQLLLWNMQLDLDSWIPRCVPNNANGWVMLPDNQWGSKYKGKRCCFRLTMLGKFINKFIRKTHSSWLLGFRRVIGSGWVYYLDFTGNFRLARNFLLGQIQYSCIFYIRSNTLIKWITRKLNYVSIHCVALL